jgi:hypothetical protein
LKPKLTYAKGRNPHEDFSEDEVNSRYPNIPQDPKGYKKMEKQEDLQWSPPTRRRRNRSLTIGRHTVGGAPPPKAISAQAQDDPKEWFPLGLGSVEE